MKSPFHSRTSKSTTVLYTFLSRLSSANCQLPTPEHPIKFSAASCQLSHCHLVSVIVDCRVCTKSQLTWDPRYVTSGRTQQKAPFPNNPSIPACVSVAEVTCLPSRRLVMNVHSDSNIPAFRRHVYHMVRLHRDYNHPAIIIE
jgi:hypothetical protein